MSFAGRASGSVFGLQSPSHCGGKLFASPLLPLQAYFFCSGPPNAAQTNLSYIANRTEIFPTIHYGHTHFTLPAHKV